MTAVKTNANNVNESQNKSSASFATRPRRKADSVVKGTMYRWEETGYAEFHPVVGKGEPTREMLKQVGNSSFCKNLGKKESSYSLHLNIDAESADPVGEMEELFHLLTEGERKHAPKLPEGCQGRMLFDDGKHLQVWLDSERGEVNILTRLECGPQIERLLLQMQASMNVTLGRYRSEIINNTKII